MTGGNKGHATEDSGHAPVDMVVGGPSAAAAGGVNGGLSRADLTSALRDLDRMGAQIGTHDPISARTTGSSTTEAVGEGARNDENMAEDNGGAEEIPRDQSKRKEPIVSGDSERQ